MFLFLFSFYKNFRCTAFYYFFQLQKSSAKVTVDYIHKFRIQREREREREREMRFRAAFRVCKSRNRAPLLLQPQASRSFSQLPLNPQRFVSLLYSLFMLCELSF